MDGWIAREVNVGMGYHFSYPRTGLASVPEKPNVRASVSKLKTKAFHRCACEEERCGGMSYHPHFCPPLAPAFLRTCLKSDCGSQGVVSRMSIPQSPESSFHAGSWALPPKVLGQGPRI